jgi:hypothetical protein
MNVSISSIVFSRLDIVYITLFEGIIFLLMLFFTNTNCDRQLTEIAAEIDQITLNILIVIIHCQL